MENDRIKIRFVGADVFNDYIKDICYRLSFNETLKTCDIFHLFTIDAVSAEEFEWISPHYFSIKDFISTSVQNKFENEQKTGKKDEYRIVPNKYHQFKYEVFAYQLNNADVEIIMCRSTIGNYNKSINKKRYVEVLQRFIKRHNMENMFELIESFY